MRSTKILNIVLATIALALIAGIWLSNNSQQELDTSAQTHINLHPKTITISHPGEQDIELRNTNDGWLVRHNIQREKWVSASAWKIEQTLLALKNAETTFVSRTAQLDHFGLNQPLITLYLDTQRVDFGSTDPIRHRRYLLIDNNIYTSRDEAYRHLIDDYYGFVDKFILPRRGKIVSITSENFKMWLDAEQRWHSNLKKALSADTIQQTLDEWQNLSAISVGKITNTGQHQSVSIQYRDGSLAELQLVYHQTRLSIINTKTGFEYELPAQVYSRLLPHNAN